VDGERHGPQRERRSGIHAAACAGITGTRETRVDGVPDCAGRIGSYREDPEGSMIIGGAVIMGEGSARTGPIKQLGAHRCCERRLPHDKLSRCERLVGADWLHRHQVALQVLNPATRDDIRVCCAAAKMCDRLLRSWHWRGGEKVHCVSGTGRESTANCVRNRHSATT
jgi:hypothetical protein